MREWTYRSSFLISALVGGEWSAWRPGRFTSVERAPGTHWIGGGENSWPCRDSNSDPSVVRPVASRYIDCAIPAPLFIGLPCFYCYFRVTLKITAWCPWTILRRPIQGDEKENWKIQVKSYKKMAVPKLLHGSETWIEGCPRGERKKKQAVGHMQPACRKL
jgi:hypothetical protein